MAWFNNHYECARCGYEWSDEWSCTCDDDCPHCGARHMTPLYSDDLTEVSEVSNDVLVLLRSSDSAEHAPDYREVARISLR
jgi:DNA-directed RNA polymerase subunit RPC12/RpoP